jgi:hypothetical protein
VYIVANISKSIYMPGMQILCHKNCPGSGQAAFKESIRKLSVRTDTKLIHLTQVTESKHTWHPQH